MYCLLFEELSHQQDTWPVGISIRSFLQVVFGCLFLLLSWWRVDALHRRFQSTPRGLRLTCGLRVHTRLVHIKNEVRRCREVAYKKRLYNIYYIHKKK